MMEFDRSYLVRTILGGIAGGIAIALGVTLVACLVLGAGRLVAIVGSW